MLRSLPLTLVALLFILAHPLAVACPFGSNCPSATPCPSPTPSECIVTTECEFKHALCWRAACGACDIIRIASNVTLQVSEGIHFTSAHSGTSQTPLKIIIEGTIEWIGDPVTSCNGNLVGKVFSLWDVSHIVFEGGGTITSPYTPCQVWHCINNETEVVCDSPSNGVRHIGVVFGGSPSGGTAITVQDLTISKFRDVFLWDAQGFSPIDDVKLKNLTIETINGYGGFFGNVTNLRIEDCHLSDGVRHQHGFRFRAANGVTILDSSVTDLGGTGFRMQDGSNLVVNGFVSNGRRCEVGPQPDEGSAALRVLSADVQNVTVTGTDPADIKMRTYLGLLGGWFDNITSDLTHTLTLHIGQNQIDRPYNKVYWGYLTNGQDVTDQEHSCIGPNLGLAAASTTSTMTAR